MKIIQTPEEMSSWRRSQTGRTLGFVPTMGALHAGHQELLNRACRENDLAVLSVFVNPAQFNDSHDFANYPNTLDADLALARSCGVEVAFTPIAAVIYPDDYKFKMIEDDFSKILCGKDRPGHFDGVLTVVMKLLNLVNPTRSYFGEKDFQQLTLIQNMVKAFFLPVEIVPVPTVREIDGLAMSSRNLRLTSEERKRAPRIYELLRSEKTTDEVLQQLNKENFQVDYLIDLKGRRFAAVRLGAVRLIDNVEIKNS